MAYEGKHRRDDSDQRGGTARKVAGLTGLAATAAAVATVGIGAGTANADGGILHNLFSPNKPSGSSSPNVNANITKPTSVFGKGFGQIVTKTAATTVSGTATPIPNSIGNYFGFNKSGWSISGLCVNPNGC
jgi:hypothetical protein